MPYGINLQAAQALQQGHTIQVVGRGNSMTPKVRSGDVVEVAPILDHSTLRKGDIVLCKVNGHFYLHLISAISPDAEQFQISNNHGRINGWTNRKNVIGKLVRILTSG